MAVRLEKGVGSNADHWLRLQAAYDLAQLRMREDPIEVKRFVRKAA
jgi:plasmid maintenance system antidote protein VapI